MMCGETFHIKATGVMSTACFSSQYVSADMFFSARLHETCEEHPEMIFLFSISPMLKHPSQNLKSPCRARRPRILGERPYVDMENTL